MSDDEGGTMASRVTRLTERMDDEDEDDGEDESMEEEERRGESEEDESEEDGAKRTRAARRSGGWVALGQRTARVAQSSNVHLAHVPFHERANIQAMDGAFEGIQPLDEARLRPAQPAGPELGVSVTHVLLKGQRWALPYGTDVQQCANGDSGQSSRSSPHAHEGGRRQFVAVDPANTFHGNAHKLGPDNMNSTPVRRDSDGDRWVVVCATEHTGIGGRVVRLEPTTTNTLVVEMNCNGGKSHQHFDYERRAREDLQPPLLKLSRRSRHAHDLEKTCKEYDIDILSQEVGPCRRRRLPHRQRQCRTDVVGVEDGVRPAESSSLSPANG